MKVLLDEMLAIGWEITSTRETAGEPRALAAITRTGSGHVHDDGVAVIRALRQIASGVARMEIDE